MPVLDPIIADLIERARSRPAPHTARADGRIFFAWPDGRLVRWEITEGGAVTRRASRRSRSVHALQMRGRGTLRPVFGKDGVSTANVPTRLNLAGNRAGGGIRLSAYIRGAAIALVIRDAD